MSASDERPTEPLETLESAAASRRSRRPGVGTGLRIVVGVAAVALVLAGAAALARDGLGGGTSTDPFDVAATTSPDATPDEDEDVETDRPDHPRLRGPHGFPGHGFGKFSGGPLHGEFVVPDPDGEGYRTVVTQRGQVRSVGDDSLTVRSDDGFTQTYRLTDETVALGGIEGLGQLAEGDLVHVSGVRTGDSVRAVHVADLDRISAPFLERFRHRSSA